MGLAQKDAVDYVLALVQVLTLIALITYVWKTWQMASATRESVDEMRATRDEESRPYVLLFAERNAVTSLFFDITLRNFGRTAARDVRLSFDPPLQASRPDSIERCTFLNEGVSLLPPGSNFRTFFDSSMDYFKEDRPLRYTVHLRYWDVKKAVSYDETIVLNLDQFRGMTWIGEKNLGTVAKELEKTNEHLKKLVSKTGEISDFLSSGLMWTSDVRSPDGKRGLWYLSAIASIAGHYARPGADSLGSNSGDLPRVISWLRRGLLLEIDEVGLDGTAGEDWALLMELLDRLAGFRWWMGQDALDTFRQLNGEVRDAASALLNRLNAEPRQREDCP